MSTTTAGIAGVEHPCYVADALLDGIGGKVAEALENETLISRIRADLPKDARESIIAFNNLPDDLVARAEEYLSDRGGCDFDRTGQCPLVGFLIDRVMEDY